MRVRLPPSALTDPARRGSIPLEGLTPWPSGEARACKARSRRFDPVRCLRLRKETRHLRPVQGLTRAARAALCRLCEREDSRPLRRIQFACAGIRGEAERRSEPLHLERRQRAAKLAAKRHLRRERGGQEAEIGGVRSDGYERHGATV